MISHEDIQELVGEWGLRDYVVEKDYVIGWLLWGIGSEERLKDAWVFKGGTCLKKCFIETWRFSEDLDFTVLPGGPIQPDEVQPLIAEVLNRVNEESGIDFTVKEPIYQERYPGSVECRIYYNGPRRTRQLARVKLDLMNAEKVVSEPVFKSVSNPFETYEGPFPPPATVKCYSMQEVFAEKIRAMGERCRPRDLYDIINLYRARHTIRAEPEIIKSVLTKKCETKGVEQTTLSLIESSPFRGELISEWENMLGHQLQVLPPFEHFWQELPELFDWLETRKVIPRLQPIPQDYQGRNPSWAPPRTIARWGKSFSFETIRFAAFNHLCLEMMYTKPGKPTEQYQIEPYSLYRTRENNLILRAVKSDTGEECSFIIDRIQSVKATQIPFIPRFSIDMV